MSAEWWIRENDSVDGPFQAKELETLIQDGRLTPETELRLGRTTQWTTADTFPWLTDHFEVFGGSLEELDLGGDYVEELTGNFGETDTSPDLTSHIVLGGLDEHGTGIVGRPRERSSKSVVTLATWGLFALSIVVVVSVILFIFTGEDEGDGPPGPPSVEPTAMADEYEVDKGKQVDGASVLTNDTVAEGKSLSAELVSDVSSGTLDLESDGTFRYEHDDSETSSDRFTYKANDGSLDSNTVTVVITVTPPKIRPDDIIRDVNDEKRNTRAIGLVVDGWHGTNSDGDLFDHPSIPIFYTLKEYANLSSAYKERLRRHPDDPLYYELLLGSTGTCFLISPDGYAITNKHVIEEYTKVKRASEKITKIKNGWKFEDLKPRLWVFLDGDLNNPHETEVVFESSVYDLAILKISGIQNNPFYRLHSGESIPRGTDVFVLGFPGAARDEITPEESLEKYQRALKDDIKKWFKESDLKYSQTDGTVSVVADRSGFGLAITHNADVNSGNSGGPLMTENGCVVGINTLSHRGASGIFISLAVTDKGVIEEIKEAVPDVVVDEDLD